MGGGLFSAAVSGTNGVESTIIAGNTAKAGYGPDGKNSGTFIEKCNFIGNNTNSPFTAGSTNANGSYVGTATAPLNPLVLPLANNGGPAMTMALQWGSLAVDHGSNPDNLAYDQRGVGFVRVVGAGCDIGAYEFSTPVVDNGLGVTGLGTTYATLNGSLYTTGNWATLVAINWGTDTNNWANTVTNSVSAGTGAFSNAVANLLYGLTYYYDCLATNAGGGMTTTPTNFVTAKPGGTAIGLSDMPATNLTTSSAVLNAALSCSGAVYGVMAYWNTFDGGTNAAAWTNSATVGWVTNRTSTSVSCTVTGLTPLTTYYYTFQASNALDGLWATNVLSFSTYGVPRVNNGVGVTNSVPGLDPTVTGMIVTNGGSPARAFVGWGPSDAGTGAWPNTVDAGIQIGEFSTDLADLQPLQGYWYRCYATNVWGIGWAPSSTNFTAPDRVQGTIFKFR